MWQSLINGVTAASSWAGDIVKDVSGAFSPLTSALGIGGGEIVGAASSAISSSRNRSGGYGSQGRGGGGAKINIGGASPNTSFVHRQKAGSGETVPVKQDAENFRSRTAKWMSIADTYGQDPHSKVG